MTKQVRQSFGGMLKDISKSKPTENDYFDASNIRVFATDKSSTYALSNEKGTKVTLEIPNVRVANGNVINAKSNIIYFNLNNLDVVSNGTYINHRLNGYAVSSKGIVLFTIAKSNNIEMNFIWHYVDDILTLLYIRKLDFDLEHPITAICNYENDTIEKVYWIDGKNQLRSLNLYKSIVNGDYENIQDTPQATLDMVSSFNMTQPQILGLSSGGKHTAGRIQYGYNLYRINSSQTQLSPLSSIVSLNNGTLGGGDVNEIVNTTPIVNITGIDPLFTNIKIYSIKYNTYLGVPVISVIRDQKIPKSRSITLYDDNTVLYTTTPEELLFLGSDIIIPESIAVKDHRLFYANYQEKNFHLDLDLRAYSFSDEGVSKTYHNVKDFDTFEDVRIINSFAGEAIPNNPKDSFDTINLDFDKYNKVYRRNSSEYPTRGGTGYFCEYQLNQTTEFDPKAKYFKDNEIYRLGIIFFNKYGKSSNPIWVADFKAGEGNLLGYYNILKFKLNQNFFNWLAFQTDDYNKPVAYKVLIAERRAEDKTIIASGLISNMFVNFKDSRSGDVDTQEKRQRKTPTQTKLPSLLMRNSDYVASNSYLTRPLSNNLNYALMSRPSAGPADYSDTELSYNSSVFGATSWQYNEMFQMYCPEAIFNDSLYIPGNAKMIVKGYMDNTFNSVWTKEMNPNGDSTADGKGLQGVSPRYSSEPTTTTGSLSALMDYGLVSHPGGTNEDNYMRTLFFRQYGIAPVMDIKPINLPLKTPPYYHPAPIQKVYNILGTPEYTRKGQSYKSYNQDSKYRYTNTLQSVKTDGQGGWKEGGKYGRRIVSIASDNNSCITFVPIHQVNTTQVIPVDTFTMMTQSNILRQDGTLYCELIKDPKDIYFGGLYGGNRYEDKLRTKYLEIGDFNKLTSPYEVSILSPGDTYVQNFKFLRMSERSDAILDQGTYHLEEIVEYVTETTIDLTNRNDDSHSDWDAKITYGYDNYHKYNRVYSQPNNFIIRQDEEYTNRRNEKFGTSVMASKLKTSGELIDNWLDLLPNETLDLDGRFGPINSLMSFADEVYAFQDDAISFLSINPRIQMPTADGLGIQLGVGGVLQDYNYLSTTSGSKNKYSICATPYGIYYFDFNNNRIGVFNGKISHLTEVSGLHSFMQQKNLSDTKQDLPQIGYGVVTGYDPINSEVLMTFKTSEQVFTLVYSEKNNRFISHNPNRTASWYIGRGDKFFSNNSNQVFHQHNVGKFNEYQGVNQDSTITFLVNPESDFDCVIDNLMFKSEVYDKDGNDLPNSTITHIRVYNEHQDSGKIPLISNRRGNLRRTFRDWNVIAPRNKGSRSRIRNPWNYIELTFNNPDNKELILHDIVITYGI